jgi:D-alanyl-D-alanine carboxypeptidase (penicillin-binding protein 5/6)
VLQGGARRRTRRAGLARLAVLIFMLAAVGIGLGALRTGADVAPDHRGASRAGQVTLAPKPARASPPPKPVYATILVPNELQVHPKFKKPPQAGILWDIDTGRVLWQRRPDRRLPIASLTKMMTAVLVNDASRSRERVRITKHAATYPGSGVGLLPKGKTVPLEPLLYGLMLPSGNDAAVALAEHEAGTEGKFVRLMNDAAGELQLPCSRFSSASGFIDRHNRSCAHDLALLAREIIRRPRLAKVVRTRSAALRFPIKGGKLYVYNNNPLLRTKYPGTIGMKTGFTAAAGRCLVAVVRRGSRRLGVVLLHSYDPGRQAERLFDLAFG